MIHNNKKGFTLVELLAVIVILGILLMIGNMSIDAIALRVRKNQHENLVKKIKVAAEKYFDDKSTTTVTVKDLIENGYISADNNQGNLKSPETGDDLGCHRLTLSEGSVTMDETCQDEGNIVSNDIKIVYCFGANGTNCYAINDSKNDEWQNGVNKTSGVGSVGMIYLRAYMVSSGQLLSSGKFKWINPINPDKVVNDYFVSIPFGTENSGYYNELFQLTYEKNDKEYTTQKQVMLDSIVPVCTNSGDSTNWLRGNRTIKWGCIDEHSKCDLPRSEEGEHTYSTSIKTSTISAYDIYDYAGNKVTCNPRVANVYVDKTSPKCNGNNGSTAWTSSSRTITQYCSDDHSGCTANSYSTTYSSTTVTSSTTIRDRVGNTRTCDYNVYVDTTAPSCSTTKSGTGSTSGVDVSVTCSDSHSQVKSCPSGGDNLKSSKTYTVTDNVGNSGTCTVSISSYDCNCNPYYSGTCTCKIESMGEISAKCSSSVTNCTSWCKSKVPSYNTSPYYPGGSCTYHSNCKTCYK